MQRTIATPLEFTGTGLHSGATARLRILPAEADTGIRFVRRDIHDADPLIAAEWSAVLPSQLCTLIANDDGVEVSTVEHLMAALAGCGIHNALIEVDGRELPILDGSAAPFVDAILSAGIFELDRPAIAVEILKDVTVSQGEAWARLEPGHGFSIEFSIDFPDAAIGRQARSLDMANGAFVRELCDSRTFCRYDDVEAMRKAGLVKGGSLRNALVVEGAHILTPGGARHKDEAVRHKMLDALGDLALIGAPIMGRFTAHRGGHALTNRLLHKLAETPGAMRRRPVSEAEAARLPGVGLHRADMPAVA